MPSSFTPVADVEIWKLCLKRQKSFTETTNLAYCYIAVALFQQSNKAEVTQYNKVT